MHFIANNCLIRCAVIAICIFVGSASAEAQQQWLVLKNNQTIEGTVSFDQQRYTVTTSSGSRIVIPKADVSFVANSIRDLYWDKWSRVDPQNPQSHMSLFRWCLKHDLMAEAQTQIDLVAKTDGIDDQSSYLSRMAEELELVVQRKQKESQIAKQQEIEQLEIRHLPPVNPTTELAVVPTIPSITLDSEGRQVRQSASPSPKQSISDVQLVDFEEELEKQPKPTRREKSAWVSNRQLDRETRAMPDGTVLFYRRHIEQKLIANCIACHDSRSQVMPLSKRSFGQTIPRRMSQQNLHFVLEQVDRAKPLESSLIAMATTAHGDQKTAAFQPNDPFLFDLKKWTVAVADDPAKWLMKLSEASRIGPPVKEEVESSPVDAEQPSEVQQQPEVQPKQEPSDPYDPAGFNRQ